ncbi:MAG: SAM-dependent chlorinase/fluorinase [Candidatus Caldarchaeum sp.]|nr:SAM-dependent chlorinase/fluorinase [Candidatus Caldarchaeum sp.]MCS7137176.1 SAM-dependent chlorinase/fluorinase [Candidatus Caldarchaeum sp.]MDW7977588.1 SAM-dependent chlorinase/fluorinase [Candidatus Caldarchaeum sp.]MDW8359625.1 SAM-dependent chlorinase/fluorinase [Candidatus Caldarchaeum sp.]
MQDKYVRTSLVALLTDYGLRDTYVSEVKAVLLKHRPDLTLVDITHEVESFNTLEGAFLLELAARTFPDRTAFLAVVDPGVGGERNALLVETARGRLFTGPDTGLLYPAVQDDGVETVWRIKTETLEDVSPTFHGRDVFARVLGKVLAGENWMEHVERLKTMKSLSLPEPRWLKDSVEATVLHVDRFGNVILNIKNNLPKGWRSADVAAGEKSLEKVPIVSYYAQTAVGQPALLVGGTGFLEVSVNMGSAAQKLGVKPGDKIIISKSRS